MTKDFSAERAKLRQQMQDLNREERLVKARDNRAQARAAMTPEQVLQQKSDDILTAKVFSTTEGKEYLSRLANHRPVVHDEILESISRAANVTENSGTAKPAAE